MKRQLGGNLKNKYSDSSLLFRLSSRQSQPRASETKGDIQPKLGAPTWQGGGRGQLGGRGVLALLPGGMSKLQTGDAVCPEQGLAQDQPRAKVGSCWVEASERGRVRQVLYWGEGLADLGAPALC